MQIKSVAAEWMQYNQWLAVQIVYCKKYSGSKL